MEYVDEQGVSLHGLCGFCQRDVDNHDTDHRVTPTIGGGRGVECVWRGDIAITQAGPLGPRASADYVVAARPRPRSRPGLDKAMSDEKLRAFTAGARPQLQDPPVRRWPAVELAATAAGAVGLVLGAFLTPVQVLLTLVVLLVAAGSVAWIEHRDTT